MAEQTLLVPQMSAAQIVRQAGVLIAIAAAVALGVYVVLWARTPSYEVLFSDLADRDMAEVVSNLQSSDIPYRIDPGAGTILIPSAHIADARLKLASSGLPRGASVGMEMLNEDPGFGTSQFMELARYQYATEGELARTIKNINDVRNARVHLAIPKQSAFAREQRAPSASVVLELYPGRRLESGQVDAIAHLVAASVPNLTVGNVMIVDQQGTLLSRDSDDDELAITAKQFEFTQQREAAYAKRIRDILAPIVGYDGVQAQVNATFDFTASEEYSDRWDPQQQVLRSEQTLEEDRLGANASGIPGALANEPPGAATAPETLAAAADGGVPSEGELQQPRNRRTEATRNYELGRTVSHVKPSPGLLQRLSVAVLVRNPAVAAAAEGADAAAVSAGFSPEQLENMSKLIKEAIGFDTARGDTVQVLNTDFFEPPAVEPLPDDPIWQQPWLWNVGKQIAGGLFVLFLVFGVLRPVFKSLMVRPVAVPALAGAAMAALPPGQQRLAALPAPAGLAGASSGLAGDIDQIKQYVAQDPKVAAQVVKNWVGDE